MSKGKKLLDASALLAAVQNEQGSEKVMEQIDACLISSVNWSEVIQKLKHSGANAELIESNLKALGLTVIDFNEEDAKLAANLWQKGKEFGLSIADRACLASGIRLSIPIITADRIWTKLDTDAEIEFIR